MVGKTILHYKIIEKIGKGGMGEVYLAEDTELDRKIALKFLPPQYDEDAEIKTRFKREAKAAAALNHPATALVRSGRRRELQLATSVDDRRRHADPAAERIRLKQRHADGRHTALAAPVARRPHRAADPDRGR